MQVNSAASTMASTAPVAAKPSMSLSMDPAILSPDVAAQSPLLVGTYEISKEDRMATWRGKWGMNEAAFDSENGVTSPFEMKSQAPVARIANEDATASNCHPAMLNVVYVPTTKTTNDDGMNTTTVSTVFLGYDCLDDASSMPSLAPWNGQYEGFFQIQGKKVQTVTEKNVELQFVHDVAHPERFIVRGSGENRFGVFALHGTLNKPTRELRVYKVYKPKAKATAGPGRRGRGRLPRAMIDSTATSAASTPTATAVSTPKLGNEALSMEPEPELVTTPTSEQNSPSARRGRGRPERKRSLPVASRDAKTMEEVAYAGIVKKCSTILKKLMANTKAVPFLVPVDPVALGIPDYFKVITSPMDLGTVRQNLDRGVYHEDPSMFVDHVRLTFHNAMHYNAAHSQVHIFAKKLLDEFEKRIKPLNIKTTSSAEPPFVASLDDTTKSLQRQGSTTSVASTKLKRDKKAAEVTVSSYSTANKVRGGKGTKGNSKRRPRSEEQALILSLKEDIEKLQAQLEQYTQQPKAITDANGNTKIGRNAFRPFKMEDLTEEELNTPMTQMEKARLSSDIRMLPQDKMNRVLQIIAEAVPINKYAEHEEVELDMDAFDTRCLRMLEGYVREHGIGRKRRRPVATAPRAKKPKTLEAASTNRLIDSARAAAMNIQSRKEELATQLATYGHSSASHVDHDVGMTDADKNDEDDDDEDGNSSSDQDDSSDSDSSDDEVVAQLEAPSLMHAPSLSQIDPLH